MIPRTQPRAPTRDDLAQQVSWLPWGTFRGSGAKTANEVLDVAKGMEREGATPHEIADETAKFAGDQETGFNQNPAKQWGYELSDKDAMLTPQALDWMKAKFSGGYGGDTPEVDLGQLYQHESLYDRAPDMAKIKTTLEQPEPDAGILPHGAYDAPNTAHGAGTSMGRIFAVGDPKLDPNALDPWSLRGLVAHEVNHGIQQKYNLPIGGYKEDPVMGHFFNTQMQPQIDQMRIKYETDREKTAADYARIMGGGEEHLQKGREEWQKAFPDKNLLITQARYAGGGPGNAKAGIASTPAMDSFQQYRSLVGEQSSNAAADRMGWSTEQRRANPMFEASGTDKLSPAMQMIRWGVGSFQKPDPLWSAINTVGRR